MCSYAPWGIKLCIEQIDRVFRKWLKRVPLPLRPQDREAGYDWALSIWQMEVSLTQIFDRPLRERRPQWCRPFAVPTGRRRATRILKFEE